MKIEKVRSNPDRWVASGEIYHGVTIFTGGDTREEARQRWEEKANQVRDAGTKESEQ